MIDVLQDEDSSSCIGCGKRSENYKDFRIIKISKDGRSSSCTGSLCKFKVVVVMKGDLFRDICAEKVKGLCPNLYKLYDKDTSVVRVPMGDYMVCGKLGGEPNYQLEGLRLLLSGSFTIDDKKYNWVMEKGNVFIEGITYDGICFRAVESI